MIPLKIEKTSKVLCLGAHCDDIEIGCGGTLLRLLEEYPRLEVYWAVFSGSKPRVQEARNSAHSFLKTAVNKTIQLREFRESYFPQDWPAIKEFFEQIKNEFNPDIVFTHYRDDRHQDHRVLSDLTWNTFRDHVVLEYEIIKYDGDLGHPNFFVELRDDLVRRKVAEILKHFKTQADKHWFTEDTFLSMMRIRGIECATRSRYAEAFYARKIVL